MKQIHKIARHMANPKRQSGQAIVLIAMLMIILLASLGLAIDGGGMFLLWRDAQNAADAAAIQAAFAYCTSGDSTGSLTSAVSKGLQAAEDNGFDDAGLTNGDNEVIVGRASQIDPTLVSPPYSYPDIGGVILVEITAVKPSYFIQVVYGGPLQVVARAISACSNGSSPFDKVGMYSMASNADCGYGDDDQGSNQLVISGSVGHIFGSVASNGNMAVQSVTYFHDGLAYFTGGIKDSSESNILDANGDEIFDTLDAFGNVDFGEAYVGPAVQSNFPTLYTTSQFDSAQNGEIWQDLVTEHGANINDYYYRKSYSGGNETITYPDFLSGNEKMLLEGLIFLDAEFAVIDGDKFYGVGPKGVTIVTTGELTVDGTVAGGRVLVFEPFIDNLLFFTDYDNGGACSGGGNDGVKVSSDIVAFGIVYAPTSAVKWSGSDILFCGASIAWTNEMSGSNKWFFSSEFPNFATLSTLTDVNPVYANNGTNDNMDISTEDVNGNVERTSVSNWQRLTEDYATGCDFIDSDPPSYYMGSTQ